MRMCPAVAVPVRAGFWWEVCFVVTVFVAAHILEDDFLLHAVLNS
jgi:hypothetical protein